ncbi:unnamed protein product, partial [Symbiodinium pilosum]
MHQERTAAGAPEFKLRFRCIRVADSRRFGLEEAVEIWHALQESLAMAREDRRHRRQRLQDAVPRQGETPEQRRQARVEKERILQQKREEQQRKQRLRQYKRWQREEKRQQKK